MEDIVLLLKEKLGNKYPEDLIVEKTKEGISFYIKSAPQKNTVFAGNKKEFIEDIDYVVERINQYYLR